MAEGMKWAFQGEPKEAEQPQVEEEEQEEYPAEEGDDEVEGPKVGSGSELGGNITKKILKYLAGRGPGK